MKQVYPEMSARKAEGPPGGGPTPASGHTVTGEYNRKIYMYPTEDFVVLITACGTLACSF